MVRAVVRRRCRDPPGVGLPLCFFSFFIARKRGWAVTRSCTRSSKRAHPPCTNANASPERLPAPPPLTPTHAQHLTRISAALRHSPLSSFPFHQNIADEVLSSINHSAAPLHSPPPPPLISRSVVQRGQTCLCCRRMCLHPQNAFTYKRIQAGTSWSLIYFGIRGWAGLDFTLVIF